MNLNICHVKVICFFFIFAYHLDFAYCCTSLKQMKDNDDDDDDDLGAAEFRIRDRA